MTALYIILGIVAVAAICVISISNGLIRKHNKIDEARSGIEVALTKRYDMLTKLLDVAKAYAKHEKDIFSQVISLRSGMYVVSVDGVSAKVAVK